jgi:hypothetical protein
VTVGLKTWDDLAGFEFPIRVQLTGMHRQLAGELGHIIHLVNRNPGLECIGIRVRVRLDRVINGQQEYSSSPEQVKLHRKKRRRKVAA